MSDWTPMRSFAPDVLEANLRLLREHHPGLLDRLIALIDDDSVLLRTTEDGYAECAVLENNELCILINNSAIQKSLPNIRKSLPPKSARSEASLIFVMGWDLGYAFKMMFDEYLDGSLLKVAVIVEPDIRLFAASLAVHSFQKELASDNIFFAIGANWADDLHCLAQDEHLFSISRIEAFSSCPSATVYNPPLQIQVRRIAQQALASAQKKFENDLTQTQHYYNNKPPEDIKKLLAIDFTGGMAVYYIYKRFLDECAAQGTEVVYHKPSAIGGISLIQAIIKDKPDALVFVNLAPEIYAPLVILNKLRLPRMVWFLDDPHNFIEEEIRFGQHDFIFSWDDSYQQFFRAHNAQSVDHFPYVADLDKATAVERAEFKSPISYIGQVGKLVPKYHNLDSTTAKLVQKAGEQKALEPHRTYHSLVKQYQEDYGLKIILNDDDEVPRRICYAIYIVGNALRRIHVLERVMPYGLKLYGNHEWLDVLGDHPLRECYMGPADPQKDVPDIFVSSIINLNIHSLHALTSLNQRDFNCPLLGAFLLTDWVEGADAFFEPDREMAFYHDLDELDDKVRFYLDNADARQQIINCGRERVLRQHTYAARVPKVLDTLRDRIRERY